MKTLKTILFSLAATAFFSSCSSDDDNNDNSNDAAAGTYNLTAVIAPLAVDYNQDGTSSENLMQESPCYLDSHIKLEQDMTYTSTYSYVLPELESTCYSEESFGTWEQEGNTIIITDASMGNNELTTIYTLNEDDTLVILLQNSTYPDRDESGHAIYSTGDVQLVYTKVN